MPGRRVARRRRRRISVRLTRRQVIVTAGVLVIGVAVWLGREAVITRSALLDASDQARTLQEQISDGDSEAATSTLTSLQQSTDTARTHTDGPLWATLTGVPFIGDSVKATRVVSSSLADIAERAIPPVVKVSSSLNADVFRPTNGRFDVATMRELSPSVTAASEVLTENGAKIQAIDTEDLIGSVRRPIASLKHEVADAQFAASAGARALRLAPTMLGAEGKRKYLLLFQNNAEVRSTGGLPGAFAILTAKRGKITFGRQGSGTDIPRFAKPVVELTEEELDIYGELMATDFRDTNFTPEYRRTAEIARTMVEGDLQVDIDGVLSVDPVALQYLLKSTGPVQAARGTTLTSKNAVDVLINQVYARFKSPLVQDAFFAVSARRIFEAVVAGKGDALTTVQQLVKASAEHRILLWSANAEEQSSLAKTRVAGEFRGADALHPQIGVYLNDSTESKMQYYLDARSTARAVSCSPDGVQSIRLTTTFRSTAPADASALPRYITGAGHRESRGNMLLDTRFFGPAGGKFTSVTVNGEQRTPSGREFKGRPVHVGAFRLEPGQSVRIVATVVTERGDTGDAVLNVTPGAQPTKNAIEVASACR